MRKMVRGMRRWLRAAAERCAVMGLACLVVGGALAYHGAVRGTAAGPDLRDAAYDGNVGRVACLLARGEPVDGRDAEGRTALTEAARAGAVDVVSLLLARGADINRATATGTTPLMVAVLWGQADVAELLLARGASVRVRTPQGEDALMAATIGGDARCVRMVLAAGADPNEAGRRCNLLSCLYDERVDVARLLLRAGLDPDVPDQDGSVPVDTLRAEHQTACVAEVERARQERGAAHRVTAGVGG